MNDIIIWELDCKIYALNDLPLQYSGENTANLVDIALVKDQKFYKFHKSNILKPYVVSIPKNISPDFKVIKKGDRVNFKIRTVNRYLNDYLLENILNVSNDNFKVIFITSKKIQYKHLEYIRSITPVNLSIENKYWRDTKMEEEEAILKLINNLCKKCLRFIGKDYGVFTKDTMNIVLKDYKVLNSFPLYTPYKGKKLKGDKFELRLQDNIIAQDLGKIALGCGLGLKNPRAFGFTTNYNKVNNYGEKINKCF